MQISSQVDVRWRNAVGRARQRLDHAASAHAPQRVDKIARGRLIGASCAALPSPGVRACVAAPAAAMVGGAQPAPTRAHAVVMLVGSRGNVCTGTAIARDLVLTAGALRRAGRRLQARRARRRPAARAQGHRCDRAPSAVQSQDHAGAPRHRRRRAVEAQDPARHGYVAPLPPPRARVAVGDRFMVAGYGVDDAGRRQQRRPPARGRRSSRPASPAICSSAWSIPRATAASAPGLGACTGDSGAPVYQKMARLSRPARRGELVDRRRTSSDGCGGLTGVTPLELYRGWIVEQARKMGSAIGP